MSLKTRRLKIFKCESCGNLVYIIESSGITPYCCGSEMVPLTPNLVDAPVEKHIPVVDRIGQCIRVTVGERAHPMTKEHYIKWVAVETERGIYTKKLKPDDWPAVYFSLSLDENIIGIYAYCNLHGLWFGEEK